MTFREEGPARAWPAPRGDAHGRRHTSALYSPWQLLYLNDVLLGKSVKIALETLLAPAEERDVALNQTREWLEAQQDRWQTLDAAWRPLVKLLVRLQNRYLPEITGRTTVLYDAEQKLQVDPWPAECERFDPQTVATELAVSALQVTEAYWFLVERGIDCEPRDGLELLRRARPRSSHKRMRGTSRQARDHFDAAQLLWLFLTDLTGDPPGRPPLWPMDGRQPERAALYDQGPPARTTRAQLQEELVQAGLYPHAVHVVGEGQSEREMVWRLVAGLLGRRWADELGFTDLGGAGSASRLNTMVNGFTTYAQRTVVIVDSEGTMAQYVTGLIRSDELPADDVLNFEANLEDSNFTPAEMLDVLIERAANPPDGRPAVALALPLEDVLAAHDERGHRTREKPGLAGILLKLAEDPKYGGPVTISKPDFATALAERILLELNDTHDDEQKLQALRERRPLLRFVLDRILPVLTGPRWE
ncbi:hypothetical protein [Actinoplanes sp. NBRC 103695]|uniref:hypothetical protein n=1 Tax=Actinoplanes sp. NBRC 103695 TaxID=3032202 RepID=UPI0024A2FB53|nr:hypothetical protein [Actinoplanes sp. NBRC 103695]GLY99649.1 hypothetical protein Acsp02_69020 [Actinoplanes sp. NBRC 103695]